MEVSYKQLKAFIEVATSSTFAEAANNLHITQPALSSAIKKLEQQVGGRLFNRDTRNVGLTHEGEVLLPNALRLIRDWDNTFNDIQNLFALKKGHLTVCAMPSFAESYLPALLSAFHGQAPDINLRVVDIVMEQVIHEVANGRCELGISFEPERKEGLIFKSLFDDQFVLVVNSDHPLSTLRECQWHECLTYPLVMMNRGSAVRQWTEEKLAMYGTLNIIAETGQLATLGKLIAHGMGISVMPSICKTHMEALGLVALPINHEPLVKRIGLLKHAKKGLSVPAETLWNLAVKMYVKT